MYIRNILETFINRKSKKELIQLTGLTNEEVTLLLDNCLDVDEKIEKKLNRLRKEKWIKIDSDFKKFCEVVRILFAILIFINQRMIIFLPVLFVMEWTLKTREWNKLRNYVKKWRNKNESINR